MYGNRSKRVLTSHAMKNVENAILLHRRGSVESDPYGHGVNVDATSLWHSEAV